MITSGIGDGITFDSGKYMWLGEVSMSSTVNNQIWFFLPLRIKDCADCRMMAKICTHPFKNMWTYSVPFCVWGTTYVQSPTSKEKPWERLPDHQTGFPCDLGKRVN